jgi:hypothetical protein
MVEEWAEEEGGIRSEIRNHEFPPPPGTKSGTAYDQRIAPPGNLMYIILIHHTSSYNYQTQACGDGEGYIIQVARYLVWLDSQSVIVSVRLDIYE